MASERGFRLLFLKENYEFFTKDVKTEEGVSPVIVSILKNNLE